jgi:hypothetical protein
MLSVFRGDNLEKYDGRVTGRQPAKADETNDTEEDEAEVAAEVEAEAGTVTPSETTANCAGDTFEYKEGKPIVSITFSLSKENPFEVNVGTSMTSYKKSEKKAFPVLCEIRDFTSGSVKREPLKNKGCIEKNLPKVLAPILTQLNSLLLDQYNAYYETKKYDDFVTAQSEFSQAPTPKPAEKGEEEEGEEGQTVVEGPTLVEGQIVNEEQSKRAAAIEVLIQKLKEKSTEQIADVNGDKLSEITKQNTVDLDKLKEFLEKHKAEVFPLYLLPFNFFKDQIFMTNNGIVTNGKKVYSYNDISIQNKKIDVLNDFLNWDFIDEGRYSESVNILNGENEDTNYIKKEMIENGDFIKGGNRRTLSKKLFKKRTTRRIRK